MSEELAKQEEANGALALNNAEIDDMFGESELDNSTALSFNVMKIMKESAQFEVAEGDYANTLVGHVLLKHNANQYYEADYDPANSSPPDCYSVDGVKPSGGENMQGCNFCSECDFNKFGSGKNDSGKACRNTVRFLFLQEGSVLPVIVIAPPTSLGKKGSVQAWFNSVPNDVAAAYTKVKMTTAKGTPIVEYWTAKVELSLAKETFGGGEASVLKIKTLEVITPKNEDLTANEDGSMKLRMLHAAVVNSRQAYEDERHAYIEAGATTEHSTADEAVDESEPFAPEDEIPA